jgi:hypothetical protein
MARTEKKVKVFGELEGALKESLKYEKGGRVDLRVTEFRSASRKFAAVHKIKNAKNKGAQAGMPVLREAERVLAPAAKVSKSGGGILRLRGDSSARTRTRGKKSRLFAQNDGGG